MSYTASVITVSDLGSQGLRQDTSGPAVCAMLEGMGFSVVHTAMLPDEAEQISAELRACADEKKIGLIVTTGGTGLSPRDVTPEATLAVLDREIRAIPVAMWVEGLKATPRHAFARCSRNARQQSDPESSRFRKGCAGESLRRSRCARTRHAHASRRRPRLSCPPKASPYRVLRIFWSAPNDALLLRGFSFFSVQPRWVLL